MRALGADGASESGAAGSRRSGQRGGGERDAQVHLHPAAVAAGADGPEIDPGLLRAERECLGLALRDPEALAVVLGTLEETDYARPAHQLIHNALMELHPERPTDEASVVGYLAHRMVPMGSGKPASLLSRVGGQMYVHDLVWKTSATPTQVGYYVHQVSAASTRRAIAERAVALHRLASTPGVDLDELQREIDRAHERLRWRPGGGWGEPRPLTRQMPPLPVSSLPGVVRRLVRAVSATTESPPDLAAFAALATLAASTRGAWQVHVGGGWTEQTCLYVAALSDSGTRKTAVVNLTTAPLRALERDLASESGGRARREILAKRYAAAVDTAAREPEGEERDQAEAEAEELEAELHSLEFQILADDVTPEALAARMERQGGPLATIVDEGGLLGTVAGRYSANVPNVDLILKAYNGSFTRVDRASRASLVIPRPILTIGLIVQPDVIAEAAKVRAFTSRGLLARFLFARPESTVGTRAGGAPPMEPEVEAEWAAVVGKVFAAGQEITARGEVGAIRLNHEATTAFEAWRNLGGHESRMHSELGDLADIQSWASKLPGALVRLAALFALAERPGDAHPVITGAEMQAALDLAPYLVEHAREVLIGTYAERAERLEAVLGFIRRFLREGGSAGKARSGSENRTSEDTSESNDIFTVKEAYRALDGRSWVTRTSDVEEIVEHLADLGYVRPLPPEPPRRGRPPSPRYQAHPRLVTAARRETA
ncbi:hypothetical protein ACG83_10365 [Frankia sp. R43]|uniref:YfjI family protein n=1 Tax=Frankia sp. R43 TaxID=269536 RepID=UPI0006CA15C5|nr:YfjI family protein [Frankia sp. R43]KPM55680.1 hypothetical protein ACG83_10365 [Frankia sp. R43]